MEDIGNYFLLSLKLVQIPVIGLLVYISYQFYSIQKKRYYKYIFIGWLFNFFQVLLLIPITFSLLFYTNPTSKFLLYSSSKFFDLLGGLFILWAIRKFIPKKNWLITKFVPTTKSQHRYQLYLGFLIAFLFSLLYYYNRFVTDYQFLDICCTWSLLLFSSYVLGVSYYSLAIYYKSYTNNDNSKVFLFLYSGALLYSVIQLLPPIFKIISPSFIDEFITESIGYSLGLVAKIFIIIGLHKHLIPIIPSDLEVAKKLRVKKGLISEAFHEIDGMGDLLEASINEINLESNKRKFQVNNKLQFVINNIEKNNIRTRDILSSYRRLVSSLTTGNYEDDIENALKRENNLNEKSVFKVNVILNMVSAILIKKFIDKRVTLARELGKSLPIYGSQYDFYQMFKAILSNAYEATNLNGKILIRTYISWVDDVKYINISISDNGMGISQKIRGEIFKDGVSFKPLSSETWQRGHGLYLVNRTIKENDYKLSLESIDNKNYTNVDYITNFTISIKIKEKK